MTQPSRIHSFVNLVHAGNDVFERQFKLRHDLIISRGVSLNAASERGGCTRVPRRVGLPRQEIARAQCDTGVPKLISCRAGGKRKYRDES